MQEHEFELRAGDLLQIGEYTVMIVEIDEDEVSVRIDPAEFLDDFSIEDGVVTVDR